MHKVETREIFSKEIMRYILTKKMNAQDILVEKLPLEAVSMAVV